MFIYFGILLLCNTRSPSEKLDSFHNRAEAIVKRNSVNRITLQSVTNTNKKRSCTLVRSCLDDKVVDPFRNYFQLIEQQIQTRSSTKIIRLPVIKTEYARNCFLLSSNWKLVKCQQLIFLPFQRNILAEMRGQLYFSQIKIDLENFGRCLRLKWYFRDSESFSEFPAFRTS